MSVIDNAIKILNDNALLPEAAALENLCKSLESTDSAVRAAAAEEIRGLCQVRAYGDLNTSTMNGWQSNSLLEEVVTYADDAQKN